MALTTNPIVYLSRKLWEYSVGNRRNVVLYVGLFVCANAVSLVEPFIVATVLNTIQAQGVTPANFPFIATLSALFILQQAGFWLFHGPARMIENRNAFFARSNFKKYLLDGALDLPPAWHTDHHSGDTIDKIEKASTALFQFSSGSFQLIESIIRLVVSFCILAYFDLTAGGIVLGMIFLTILLIIKFDKILVEQYHQIGQMENGISAKIFDVISNVTTVIILRIERLVSKSIVKKMLQPFTLYNRNHRINEVKWFLVSMSGSIMTFLVLFLYLNKQLHAAAVVEIGTIYLLYSYVQRVTDIFYRFAYQYGDMVQQRTSVIRSEQISNEFSKKKEVAAVQLGAHWKELRIESLFFSYHTEEGADLHLHDVSLSIHKGERIAFIGESGSGKTTFLKLLRGLYEPQQVRMYLDGRRLQDGLLAISPHMALIPQDPEIFATTIKENITVGVDHSLASIKKYTDMARFTDVVERLPKKLNSSIVEKGVNLSGGEKQRLALARGLMASADKSIVLLDEPTSSVDLKNESLIYQNIFKAFKDKAIISSIHRLHLLQMFDTIYFFERGRIIAAGSLAELLKTSPRFQEMWKKYQETQEDRRSA